ncbi:MAG TPA: hypothetical protein VKJ65_09640 [Phycisphaerae bacterium]|nr:hypothetical protein [Phycisphaerae bacterium]
MKTKKEGRVNRSKLWVVEMFRELKSQENARFERWWVCYIGKRKPGRGVKRIAKSVWEACRKEE